MPDKPQKPQPLFQLIIKGCHDCPFYSHKYCNLGSGFVKNDADAERFSPDCKLPGGGLALVVSRAT